MRDSVEVKTISLMGEISEIQREIEITQVNQMNSSWSDRISRRCDIELASLKKQLDSKIALLEVLTR